MPRHRMHVEESYAHAAARALERYDVALTRQEYQQLAADVVARNPARARRVEVLDGGSEAWLVCLDGRQMLATLTDATILATRWMLAVLKGGRIRTFLPLGQQFNQGRQYREKST